MGTGIDAARDLSPEHAAMIDNMKDQLIIVLIKRLGGDITLPISEVDDTGENLLYFSIDQEAKSFRFSVGKKS